MSNTTTKAIVIAVAFFLLISTRLRAGTTFPKTMKKTFNRYNLEMKYGLEVADIAETVLSSLIKAGFFDLNLKLALAQVFHETGIFKAGANLVRDNNFSGIMYINKPTIQKNAVKGRKFPSKEGNYWYAKFATPTDWANDLKRILGRSPGYPLQSTSPKDFAHRLKMNKYYTDSESNYAKNLEKHFNYISTLGI